MRENEIAKDGKAFTCLFDLGKYNSEGTSNFANFINFVLFFPFFTRFIQPLANILTFYTFRESFELILIL